MTAESVLKEYRKYVSACVSHGRWDDINWAALKEMADKVLKPKKKKAPKIGKGGWIGTTHEEHKPLSWKRGEMGFSRVTLSKSVLRLDDEIQIFAQEIGVKSKKEVKVNIPLNKITKFIADIKASK